MNQLILASTINDLGVSRNIKIYAFHQTAAPYARVYRATLPTEVPT
jgi:hypothetical protein